MPTLSKQEAYELTDLICEALMRENDLRKRIGKRGIIQALLDGRAEMRTVKCSRCGGSGKVAPLVESSGGSWYHDERKCYIPDGCDGVGNIKKFFWKDK